MRWAEIFAFDEWKKINNAEEFVSHVCERKRLKWVVLCPQIYWWIFDFYCHGNLYCSNDRKASGVCLPLGSDFLCREAWQSLLIASATRSLQSLPSSGLRDGSQMSFCCFCFLYPLKWMFAQSLPGRCWTFSACFLMVSSDFNLTNELKFAFC